MKKIILLIPLFIFLLFAFVPKRKVNIWLIGDSTIAWKKPQRDPESGWGEGLKQLVNSKATVHNHAASGRSSKSFVDQNRWTAVLDSIQPGDYVIMQFGHNDEKPDPKLHTDPATTYKEYMKKFIDETRAKKGIPIVCSSIVRRQFDGKGNLIDTHGDYIKASREVAKENKACFVDLEAATRKLVTELGPEKSKSLYVYCEPGECRRNSKGVQDSTHLNHEGAKTVALLFAQEVKKQKLPLRKYLK